jgi:anti-sigma factor RsiW
MHSLVKEHLEELLAAQGIRTSDAGVISHLAGCEACRRELDVLRAQAAIFQSLRPTAGVEPRPGFYARLMDRIEAQRRPSFWGAFLEPGFSRRIVFASLIFLVLFGGYLASSEQAVPVMASGPEAIMADTAQPVSGIGSDPQQDRDAILVTLTTYQE